MLGNLNTIGWRIFCVLCAINVALVFRFVPGFVETTVLNGEPLYAGLSRGVETGLEHVAYHLKDRFTPLYIHMLAGGIGMALVPVQFLTRFRLRRPDLHRWLGRICVLSLCASGLAAIPLAPEMPIPKYGQWGYITASVFWVILPLGAAYFALKKDFQRHQVWMIYTAAITFGAVTLRFYIPAFRAIGMPLNDASALAVWTAMFMNLAAVYFWRSYRWRGRIKH